MSNVFQRYTGPNINLDNRVGEASAPGGIDYELTLSMAPSEAQLNTEVRVTINAKRNGLPWGPQQILITSTDSLIGLVPDDIFTDATGTATFAILTLNVGTANVQAMMTVSGVTYESNVVTLSVIEFDPTENYDATGYGKVTFSVEPLLADAVFPRVQLLSHAEQNKKFPDDFGLFHAHYFAHSTFIFIPKSMIPT